MDPDASGEGRLIIIEKKMVKRRDCLNLQSPRQGQI